MNRVRFSDEWIAKVDDWAHNNAVMIRRYNAMLRYRQMVYLAQDFSFSETDQFHNLEGGDWDFPNGEDDIDADDWPE